jgi:hypothetical protein
MGSSHSQEKKVEENENVQIVPHVKRRITCHKCGYYSNTGHETNYVLEVPIFTTPFVKMTNEIEKYWKKKSLDFHETDRKQIIATNIYDRIRRLESICSPVVLAKYYAEYLLIEYLYTLERYDLYLDFTIPEKYSLDDAFKLASRMSDIPKGDFVNFYNELEDKLKPLWESVGTLSDRRTLEKCYMDIRFNSTLIYYAFTYPLLKMAVKEYLEDGILDRDTTSIITSYI